MWNCRGCFLLLMLQELQRSPLEWHSYRTHLENQNIPFTDAISTSSGLLVCISFIGWTFSDMIKCGNHLVLLDLFLTLWSGWGLRTCTFYASPGNAEVTWSFNHVLSSEMLKHVRAFFSFYLLSTSQNCSFLEWHLPAFIGNISHLPNWFWAK